MVDLRVESESRVPGVDTISVPFRSSAAGNIIAVKRNFIREVGVVWEQNQEIGIEAPPQHGIVRVGAVLLLGQIEGLI